MVVSGSTASSTGQSCPTISNSFKVDKGTGIVSTASMDFSGSSMSFHIVMSVATIENCINLRQVMDHEGIRQEYSGFWVYPSAVNFTTGLLNVQDLCQVCTITLKVVQQ